MKTTTFSIRLDEKLAYILDLLARCNNTSKAKTIEVALKKHLEESDVAKQVFEETWDLTAKNRLIKLAGFDRALLTYKEEQLLKEESPNGQS